MPELRPGDQVLVETVDATYVYRLDTDPRRLVVPFTGVLGAGRRCRGTRGRAGCSPPRGQGSG